MDNAIHIGLTNGLPAAYVESWYFAIEDAYPIGAREPLLDRLIPCEECHAEALL